MFIVHLALGGCLRAPPITFGLTADTGGHIAYVIEAARAQAAQRGVDRVSIVTRLFEDPMLPTCHARARERLAPKVTIDRIATADRRYLEKEALGAELGAFSDAFCDHLARLKRRPDVIHAHFADAARIAIAARARYGIPVVYTPHALGIDKARQQTGCAPLDERIAAERQAIERCDALIVSSEDEARRQVPAYATGRRSGVHRVAPGVPGRAPGRRLTIADRLGEWFAAPDLPIVLAIARPVRKKNLAGLLRAYAGDAELGASANLVILAGQDTPHCSAEERAVLDELARLAAAPGLARRVALPARHDACDVLALYRRAASGGVFVNPALHEPFGLTLIEAASEGVPVVATRNGGAAEIVRRIGHGVTVEPRDETAIAAHCREIVRDPALQARYATAARENVGAFDWRRYADRSVAIYRGLPAAGQARLASPRLASACHATPRARVHAPADRVAIP